jgi:hypothetical protein
LIPKSVAIRLINILLVEMPLLGEDRMGYLIPRFRNGPSSEPITEKISDGEANSCQRGLRCGIKGHAKASMQAIGRISAHNIISLTPTEAYKEEVSSYLHPLSSSVLFLFYPSTIKQDLHNLSAFYYLNS